MSKKMKRLIALLLSAMMLFSLTACGDSGNNGDDSTESPEMAALNEYFSEYEAFDMEGRVIKIGMFYDMYYDSYDTKPEDNPGVEDLERGQLQLDNIKRIEKKYNCKIEYVNVTDIQTSLTTSVVNGTPDYDVYLVQMSFALPLALNGYFTDLSTFTADYLDLNNDQIILESVDVAGQNCFFQKSGFNVSNNYLAYNAEMIEAAGLTDPRELYANGEWTWAKFEEYCTKLTQDTDNNGETDVYGYVGNLEPTIQEFLASNDAILVKEDGTEGISDPKALETFELMRRLYSESKVATLYDDFYQNNSAWMSKKSAFGSTKIYLLQTMGRQINFDYHIVPYPVGPSGTGESSGQGYGDYFVIPRGVKDPEKVYQVLEEFYGYHADDLDYRDEDKLSLIEGCFIDEADIEMALDMVYWSNGDDWTLIDAPVDGVTLVASIYGGVVSGETTPSEAVETHKQLFQTKIDEILNP